MDSLKRDRQLVIDFFCAALGGPLAYRGRDMKTSHEGLAISERDWDIFVQHTVATLENLAIAEREVNDFLAAAAGLKGDVVERPRLAGARA
jgi:hemoglobin